MTLKEKSLNPKQEAFAREYLVDLNATQAAIRAGYSEKTAYSQGQRLLNHVEVQAAIEKAKAERAERTQINADWVLRRLAAEAEADVADLYEEDGSLKPVHAWPKIWRQGLVAGLDVDEITTKDGTRIGEIKKLKLSDRVRRLELLGKHIDVSAFADRHEHTGANGGPIQSEQSVKYLIVPPKEQAEVLSRKLSPGELDDGDSDG